MATRNFCDRCGDEILAMPFILKAGSESYDLCPECKQKFEQYMTADTIQQ